MIFLKYANETVLSMTGVMDIVKAEVALIGFWLLLLVIVRVALTRTELTRRKSVIAVVVTAGFFTAVFASFFIAGASIPTMTTPVDAVPLLLPIPLFFIGADTLTRRETWIGEGKEVFSVSSIHSALLWVSVRGREWPLRRVLHYGTKDFAVYKIKNIYYIAITESADDSTYRCAAEVYKRALRNEKVLVIDELLLPDRDDELKCVITEYEEYKNTIHFRVENWDFIIELGAEEAVMRRVKTEEELQLLKEGIRPALA